MLDNLSVLLVEDDLGDVELIRYAFKKVAPAQAAVINVAHTLAEALSTLESRSYDVILLDLSLPDSSGIDSVKRIRSQFPDIAIVILTGLNNHDVALAGIEAGAQEFLVKGEISPDLLPGVLQYAVSTQLKQSEQRRTNEELEAAVEGKSLELESKEEELKVLMDSVLDYAIVMVDTEGRISSWNGGAARIFGYTEREVIGKNYAIFFENSAHEASIPQRALLQAREHGRFDLEGIRVRKDGSTFRGSSILRPLNGRNQPIEGFVFVSRDVTKMYDAQQRVIQAERLAAIGQMVTGLAHESRNALQRIQASVNRIVRRSKANPDILQITSEIESAGQDLSRLYDAIREYAAPINLQKSNFNVLDVWKAVWEKMAPIRKGVDIAYEERTCDVDLQSTLDDYRLGQVFRNLVENSIAMCCEPVRMLITCKDDTLFGEPALFISVRDNGPGIPQEKRKEVFKAFFTTRRDGTGLGLAIIKRIIEAHGGSVEIGDSAGDSEYPGAEIIMILPRNSEESCNAC